MHSTVLRSNLSALAPFLAVLLGQIAFSFVLEGSATSYAQFRKWNAALNGTLEFEFKTEQGNGLLLYTDDGGTYDFFEVKLVESALRLRYNLGGGAQIVTVGHDLGDGHWHKVQITRCNENTTLMVDSVSAVSTSRGKEFEFGKLAGNSDVYVGGMPSWYNSKLTLLALPSVIFEPRFNGFIRNLVYADDENTVPRRQEMKNRDAKCGGFSCTKNFNKRKSPRSLRNMMAANTTDACEARDPCQHGGICISTDSGPICECRTGDYEGAYCEKDKAPSEASFRGTEYLTIDLSKGDPVLSTQESISLQFKTRQPNGLLFYSGENDDYLTISLRDGGAGVGMTLAKGRLDLHIKPARVRFDDNQWHKIIVHRKVQEISSITSFCRLSAIVDGIYAEHGHTAGSFTRLASDRLLVGGGADARSLQGAKGINNFVGCLRKVEFAAEGVKMELIEAARSGAAGAAAWGKMDFHCREPRASDPITFTTRGSHLVLPPWKAAKSGSISFKIRTNEPNGLIMYSRSGAHTRPDLFAFEILGGYLYLHADLGSGPVKVRSSKQRVDDGTWHDIAMRRVERDGRVTVDGWAVEFRTPGDSTQLDLDGLLYIGGVGAPFAPLTVPPVLWTGALRQGYVGCMRDLVINGHPVDIAGYAQQQDSGAVRPACHAQLSHCPSEPCMHGGHCLEGWNRFHCDCTGTPFTGPTCGKDASTLHLNGTQQMTALMPEDSKTQAEEVIVRFKTTRPRGLLVGTSLENSADRLQLFLDEGKASMVIHVGDREKNLVVGQGLNDDMWHTLRFSRRASSLKFQVDDETAVRAEVQLGKQSVLEFRTLHVGGYLHAGEDIPHFVGQLQQIWFNGYPYLEIARSAGSHQASHQGVTPIIRVTGKFGKRNHPVHHPVTFTSKHTFVGLPVLKAYVETNVYFQFKTREANGLILYNAGRERDFIGVELVNGHIHYIFDLGDGPVRVRDTSKSRLNDGKWHAVSIGRPAPKRHTLAVDDHVTAVNSQGSNENLDLDGILYIGGVEKSQYSQLPKQILSRHGFEGCLASLDLSGESTDLISDAVVPSSLVESGCDIYANLHPGKKCTHDLCANHGTCVQQWNSYTCDCDMTTFTGPTCSDEAVAFEFGAGRGIITYTFPPDRRPEMKRDTVALGFVTNINDAVLLRIESASSNDYLEIEIVEGNVFAVYNMGTNDHPIGEVGIKVNDNQYHVVRFTRSGANSTLQVDDYNLQSNHPSGPQLSVFNSQSTIQVGGRWNRSKGRVERPFLGVIAGLVVNGARILELAATKDGRVTTRGDVQLLPAGSLLDRAAPLQRMQQTPASGFSGVMDDLIFSGAGSGCAGDDEDEECTPVYESTDDLITPVYVASTRSPTTFRSHKVHKENIQERPSCDDEEDCEEGSGDSDTTEEIFVTSASDSSSVSYTTPHEYSTSHVSTQTSTATSTSTREITTVSIPYNVSTTEVESTHDNSVVTHRSTIITTQTTTTEVTDPPPPPPPPMYPPMPTPPKNNNNKRITSEAAENAALIIGIIAAALIAIVLIILIILKFKNRPETSYKVDETKTFCHDPNAALLGAAGSGQPFNGTLKNGANGSKSNKKRELIDIKEWEIECSTNLERIKIYADLIIFTCLLISSTVIFIRQITERITTGMPDIKVTPLGAGQDVGRSCILVSMGGKNIMLDCGMHMGFNDERRFPDFSYIVPEGPATNYIDCVIISHFHLDHCGALPYFTEMVGYTGPIYMTHPTKAIAPILLEDMRKVAVERKGESNFFTSQMIKDCMKKVIAVTLHQSVMVDSELEIKAYYAGHVLGAAMFWVRVGSQSIVYTGDYNMTPDRHLGAAWIDKCRPDLLISESTYATTIRDSKRCRERDFLKKVHECIDRGGKVLIPVFALGRAQELCILLETYWERMNLKVPVYFALGLTEKANNYYKMFITWTNQKIKKTFVQRNMFDFKHIKPFDKAYIDNPGAMVVFATPGMLHAGLSLQIFKKWAPNEANMVIMPGFCVQGTVGHKVLNGTRRIEFENRQIVEVKMAVEYMSFSAHADAKGIMQLIQYCEPKNVMLVHGEFAKMEYLKDKIKQEFGTNCFNPANGETCIITTTSKVPVDASLALLKAEAKRYSVLPPDPKRRRLLHSVLMLREDGACLVDADEVAKAAGITKHVVRFTSTVQVRDPGPAHSTTLKLLQPLKERLSGWSVQLTEGSISVESVLVKVEGDEDEQKSVYVSWTNQDEDLGSYILGFLQTMLN